MSEEVALFEDGFVEALRMLVDAFDDVPRAVRVLKIAEELGEATEAYIGSEGMNPRKGKTHEESDVVKELLDVAITAIVAVGAFSADPAADFDAHVRRVANRHVEQVVNRG